MHVGIGRSGNAALPLVAGVACFALACRGFWCLKSQTRCCLGHFGIDTTEDRISQLPDDVIFSIISRLCTRDAVRTSVLSRRWRHVHTSIYEVRFRCWDMYKHKKCYCHSNRVGREYLSHLPRKFAKGVDTFLKHHSGSKIISFELVYCLRGCISGRFRKWINSVGTSGAEQLTLGFCCRDNPIGADRLYFSTAFLPEASSVKHLRLQGCSFRTPNKNALKVLELEDVGFTSEAVDCILSNCPNLQVLNLRRCVLPSNLRIHGSDLQLKSLIISQCENVTKIDLSAINLITFEIICRRFKPKVHFSHVPLLQNLVIEFSCTSISPHIFEEIAKDLPHLESLVFKNHAIIFYEGGKMDQVTSKLSNLKQLVLTLEYDAKLDLLQLLAVLDACPLLRKFHLSMLSPSTFNRKLEGQA